MSDRLQTDRTAPDARNVFQHALGAMDVQSAAIALMIMQQLKAAVDMQMGGSNTRRAVIEFRRKYRFPD